MVEPVDPFEGGDLDRFEVAPGAALTDHLGLVQTDDGLGQGIVVGIPDAAHRRLDPGVSQTLGVANRQVLAPVAVMHQDTVPMASGKPVSPSTTAIRISCRPRAWSSFITLSQNLAPSVCSIHSASTSLSPSEVIARAR